jgi:HK97 family phage major capsid protein
VSDGLKTLGDAVDAALDEMEVATRAIREAGDDADFDKLDRSFRAAEKTHTTAVAQYQRADRKAALAEARGNLPVSITGPDMEGGSAAAPRKRGAPHVRVGREPLTYELHEQDGSITKRSFFRDMLAAREGNPSASERLGAHMREMVVEKRALSGAAGQGGDMVPPVYLTDDYVKLARAGRITADACTSLELPPNTESINIPAIESGTETATQKNLGGVASKDAKTKTVTLPVITIAGQQDLARQTFERMLPGYDVVLFGDLVADYATKLDIQVLNGSGVAPNAKGILKATGTEVVTFTSASPKISELYKKLADAIQRISTNRFAAPSAIVMHPRRWAWLLASVDSNERPLVLPAANGPLNAVGNLENVAAEGRVGQVLGVPVLIDPSLPTNEGAGTNQDTIIVTRVEDLQLFEDYNTPVHMKVFEQVLSAELAIRLQCFGYSAFTAERYPKATALIQGTGLTVPVF